MEAFSAGMSRAYHRPGRARKPILGYHGQKRGSVRALSIGIVLGILGLSHGSFATQFYPMALKVRVARAPILVRGVVGNSSVREAPGPDGMVRPYTYTEIDVTEVLRGSVTARGVMVREMGGVLPDGVGLDVPGRAEFSNGEDVLLVLSPPAPDGTYDLLGLQMAKYNIEHDGRGEEIVVGPGTRLAAEDQSRTFRLSEVRDWIPPAERPASPRPLEAGGSASVGSSGATQLSGHGAPQPVGQKTDVPLTWGARLKTIAVAILVLGSIYFLQRASRRKRPQA